jgi:hypothetical protein
MKMVAIMIALLAGQLDLPQVKVQVDPPKVGVKVDLPPPGRLSPLGDIKLGSPGQELEAILQQERARLDGIAEKSVDAAEKNAAVLLLRTIPPANPQPALEGFRFELLPEVVTEKELEGIKQWQASGRLKSLRDETVEELWKVARKAAGQDQFRITDQALRAIVRRDITQEEAWRLLGYLAWQDGCATPYAVAQMQKGHVQHSKYGWIESSWQAHLDAGQLPIGIDTRTKKVVWGPADEANRAHAEWKNAWEIVTEHFRIRSNLGFADAVAFGRKLEAFYPFFFSLMADLIGPELPLAKRWRVKNLRPAVSPVVHQVAYFASKDDYIRELLPIEGESIAESIGYYRRPPQNAGSRQRGGRGMSYFFHDPGGQLPVEATLFHEASHQLLFETAGRDKLDANRGHYWLFEGLGTCFETVVVKSDREINFGKPVGARMDVARQRILENRVFTPYEVMEGYGQISFNMASKVHDHYAQAMALTLYFLVGADARTRDIFMDYARDAYKGRMRGARGLSDRLGQESIKLDSSFIKYLRLTDTKKPIEVIEKKVCE